MAIHSDKLTLKPGGIFNSKIQPVFDDEKAVSLGLDPVEDEALAINNLTREELAEAPPTKVVWDNFVTWVKKYNYRNSVYTAPIPCGYNIVNFDMPIINRLANQYGPVDKDGRQTVFSQVYKIDFMDIFFYHTEHNRNVQKRKLGDIMDFMGYPKGQKTGLHNAVDDVRHTANLLIKHLRHTRAESENIKWGTTFANGMPITAEDIR